MRMRKPKGNECSLGATPVSACQCSEDPNQIQCLFCRKRILADFEKHFPLFVDDWDDSFLRRPSFGTEEANMKKFGAFTLEGKLFGVCVSLEYFYRHTAHPNNCLRNREEDEILYYMTTMTVEEKASEDLAICAEAAAWRNAAGLWPARVSSIQRWIYEVADNETSLAHVDLLSLLSVFDEDILEFLRGDCSPHYEQTTMDCIVKLLKLYLIHNY